MTLAEIRRANDLPQTKREKDYRVQRDRLAQVLRNVLATGTGGPRFHVAEDAATAVLVEIYGE